MRTSHRACPKCGGTELWTATEAGARIPFGRPFADRLFYASLVPSMVGGAGLGVWLCGTTLQGRLHTPVSTGDKVFSWIVGTIIGIPIGAAGGMLVLMLVVAALAWTFHTLFGWRQVPARPSAGTSLEPIDAVHGGEIVRGRVVLAGPTLASPSGGAACVAFRIEGEVDGHPVDDSAAVPFLIETPDGERVAVESPPCTLQIPTGERRTPDPAVIDALRAFLSVRGLDIGVGKVRLAVGILSAGDEVEASGATRARPDPDAAAGFRQAALRTAIVETPETPLVVVTLAQAVESATSPRRAPG